MLAQDMLAQKVLAQDMLAEDVLAQKLTTPPVTTLGRTNAAAAQNGLQLQRRLRAVGVTALALAMAACAGGPAVQLGGTNSENASSSAHLTGSAEAAETFNPFANPSETTSKRRVVIENPTREQVLTPGPLDEITLGNSDAPVTVVKYFSPTCPFCRVFQREVFPQFKRAYIDTGKVRFVLREFPIGFQSGAATVAIRCAPPGQRIKLYKALLNQQARWVSQEVRRDPIFKIASKFGLSRAKFDACYDDKKLIADLKAVKDRGRTLGIIGTPNFFINERLEKRVLTFEDFQKLIDPLLGGRA